MAGFDAVWMGLVRTLGIGTERPGAVRRGWEGCGKDFRARHGLAGRGLVRRGLARRDLARQGLYGKARRGTAWLGGVRYGKDILEGG